MGGWVEIAREERRDVLLGFSLQMIDLSEILTVARSWLNRNTLLELLLISFSSHLCCTVVPH